MDKWEKLEKSDFVDMLKDRGLRPKQIDSIISYLGITDIATLAKTFPNIKKNQ